MRTRLVLSATLTIVIAGTAGCQNREPIGQGFGESVRYNMSMQIVDPQPRSADAPDLLGARAAGAMKRYEEDKVKDLRIEKTSKTGSSK